MLLWRRWLCNIPQWRSRKVASRFLFLAEMLMFQKPLSVLCNWTLASWADRAAISEFIVTPQLLNSFFLLELPEPHAFVVKYLGRRKSHRRYEVCNVLEQRMCKDRHEANL